MRQAPEVLRTSFDDEGRVENMFRNLPGGWLLCEVGFDFDDERVVEDVEEFIVFTHR